MKKALLLSILFLAMLPSFAQNTFMVSDPNSWGGSQQGTIDKAVLEVRPAGAYLEFGLELTLSSKNTSYTRQQDTLEAVLDFDLPIGAIIHDSWLWVGNDIMQGLLLEREAATEIYEGIVDRRKDPSLLFKNSATHYQLRVFPMAGHEPRKVKLTYLVPAKFTSSQMSAFLPLRMLATSKVAPPLEVIINTNATYHTPEIIGSTSVALTGPDADGRYFATIPATTVQANNNVAIAYASPVQNGIFFAHTPDTANTGYYQLVVDPKTVLAPVQQPKKIALVLHHEGNSYPMAASEMVWWCEEFLKDNFSASDSFNIIFTNSGSAYYNINWIPATPANITSVMQDVATRITNSTNPTWGNKVVYASSFINWRGGDGEIVLVTNHNKSYSTQQANSEVNNLINAMALQRPIHIVNYRVQYSPYYGSSTTNMFMGVASATQGTYRDVGYPSFFDYNTYQDMPSTERPLSVALDELGTVLSNWGVQAYEIVLQVPQGMAYNKLSLEDIYGIGGGTKVQVGRYIGNVPSQVDYNAVVNGNLVSHSWLVSQPYDSDSISRKVWGGVFISTLEGNSMSNVFANYQQIVETSMEYRVLSRNTAFLCLEPNDTLFACEGCEAIDTEYGGDGVLSSAELLPDSLMDIALTAKPNPFAGNLEIILEVPAAAQGQQIVISIVDLLGREVFSYNLETQPGTSNYTISWMGTDMHGKNLSAGVYILNAANNSFRQSLKLVKYQ